MARAESPGPSLHGFVVVDKPAGWTSHDVVARARRIFGERRVGHAGTLDPAATGVLPLAVGSATRVLEYLTEASKTYLADVVFGVSTDSHDADGSVTRVAEASGLDAGTVEAALARFRGPIEQVPPMHSAVKVGGRRLYELARRGEEVARRARPVTIHRLELLAWRAPVATLLVDCAKGTYVRSLARDLGDAVGVGAHLGDLVRVRTGPFTLCDAWRLEDLAALDLPDAWPTVAQHPDAVFQDRPAIVLDDAAATAWRHGRPVPAEDASPGVCRVYDAAGRWLGVGRGEPGDGRWRPEKVIETAG